MPSIWVRIWMDVSAGMEKNPQVCLSFVTVCFKSSAHTNTTHSNRTHTLSPTTTRTPTLTPPHTHRDSPVHIQSCSYMDKPHPCCCVKKYSKNASGS